MRIRKIMAPPVSAIFALLLTGCILEDRDGCLDRDNVTFVFSHDGNRGTEFISRVETLDLFLFDGDGKFMFGRSAATADLNPDYPAITETLAPGTYYALAWANVGDNSAYRNIVPGTPLAECIAEIDPARTRSGDPVYYAPRKACQPLETTRAGENYTLYEVVVPAGVDVVKPLDFVRAHRTIHVWVWGLSDTELPTVEACGLWSGYDFTYRTCGDRRDYTQQTAEKTVGDSVYALAVFHHAYGEIDGDMNVLVFRTSDGQLMHTVNVRQFIDENSVTDTDDIHIMLTFAYDLGVTVSIPQWGSTPVKPF